MSIVTANTGSCGCDSDNQLVPAKIVDITPGKVVEVVDPVPEIKPDERKTEVVDPVPEIKPDERKTEVVEIVQPKQITIKIVGSAKLKYHKHTKIGGGEDYLYLQNPLEVTFPEKLKVEINGVRFEVVFDWRTKLDEATGTATKCTIPAKTHFIHASVGIPFELALAQEIELPDRCPILLPAGTHLQQFSETPGLNLRVTLDYECEAFLIR
ncbi:hypothetical protein H012_gp753 [Acanthamoeba polyphaga moumouvirus]|uniref:Uncharacterized protein n=1 Tax=Acanthamoeba polyphaga moumouvirus TaxID=1269028 RepID=L7RBW7_9VIRU|nr:hypothetical protein H012_gp753 [Acanthamoeba polyphaga moumouvirus]AGC01712.1 hypothetical protein Moumou_00168 [Acanthamoeba polyphaga moumouvirus]